MREERYIWLRFSPGDYLGLREKLNSLAQEGWELAEERDCACFFARFTRTARTELCYDTEPARLLREAEAVRERVLRREAEGWEPVATLNGVDIYRSIPLRFPKPHEPDRERGKITPRRILTERWCLADGGALLLLAAAVAAVLGGGEAWYLSNLQLYLRGTGAFAVAALLYFAVWQGTVLLGKRPKQPKRWAVYFRSALGALGLVWLGLGLVMLALDYLSVPVALLVSACGLAALGAASGLWRRKDYRLYRQVAALSVGVVILSAVLLSTAYPAGERDDFLDEFSRLQYRGEPVMQLEKLGLEGEALLSGSYERHGSLLVTYTGYSEWWTVDGEDVSLATQVYQCRFGTAGRIYARLEAGGEHSVLYRSGNTVVCVDTTLPLTQEAVRAALDG